MLTVGATVTGCRIRQRWLLASWGLPADLLSRQAQLKTLALSSKVKDISWVSGSLERLSVSNPEIDRLDDIPSSLEMLDISSTGVRALPVLPPRLESLDVRWTRISDFGDRLEKSKLKSLKLGGPKITKLPSLPPSLEHLELTRTEIQDVRGLPGALRSLKLTGASFKDLSGLPANLQALTLSETAVTSLESLPPALQSLELDTNDHLKLDHLPLFLSRLSMRNQTAGDLADLHFLVSLAVRDDESTPFPNWPATLRDVTLQKGPAPCILGGQPTACIPNLPSELKSLDLSRYQGQASGPYPRRLERLIHSVRRLGKGAPAIEELRVHAVEPTGFSTTPTGLIICDQALEGMGHFPASLERLEICPSPRLKSLSGLPEGLVELNIAGTGLAALPLIPGSLTALDISNTKINSLRGLERLQSLQTLTLSADQLTTLKGMPTTVRTLRFVDSTRVEPAQ